MLDQVFSALADPTRRAIVERLTAGNALLVGEIAKPLPMSQAAVSKHLGILARAGLVTRTRVGRTTECRLSPLPMREAAGWIERHRRFWDARLDALGALVDGDIR